MKRGLVLSDLHGFARRSEGSALFASMRDGLRSVDILVLNGDIFDFRWSCLRDLETTQAAALDWLRDVSNDFPECEIHYVMGNHDCLATFQDGLATMAASQPRFQWHEYSLRLGSAVFLHGDCAHATMGAAALDRYRDIWRRDRQRGPLRAAAYACADRLGFTRLAHQWHFRRHQTVQRIGYYLDDAIPGWRHTTRDCYFGHTHLPFTGHEHEGVLFHNTGSAIRGMSFRPLSFEISALDEMPSSDT